jgi:hypothetical protein
MPNDQPIGFGRFVKQSRTERERFAAQNSSGDLKQPRLPRYVGNRCISKDVAHAGLCSPQLELGEILQQTHYLVLS